MSRIQLGKNFHDQDSSLNLPDHPLSSRPGYWRLPSAGEMPERYCASWFEPFEARIAEHLTSGVRILDVGSGRRPAILPVQRPPDCFYAGLDLSMAELNSSAPGSYNEKIEGDVADRLPELERQFDLIVSWQVLEHVGNLDHAIENIRTYLRPGGRFVALFSGTLSAFGIANRVFPARMANFVLCRLLSRSANTVFPAYYHRCYFSALAEIFSSWREVEIVPLYHGANYFEFCPPLYRIYLLYENWIFRRRFHNLATHYLVNATV